MKFFWDTNLFIYLWERKSFSDEMDILCNFIKSHNHTITSSTLTLGEILVHPIKYNKNDQANSYIQAFEKMGMIKFSKFVAVRFAQIRAEHKEIRPPDAIQLASALISESNVFLTNDERLSKYSFKGLEIYSLKDWVNSCESQTK